MAPKRVLAARKREVVKRMMVGEEVRLGESVEVHGIAGLLDTDSIGAR